MNFKIAGFTNKDTIIVLMMFCILTAISGNVLENACFNGYRLTIEKNLKKIWKISQSYMLSNGVKSVDVKELISWRGKNNVLYGPNLNNKSIEIKQIIDENYYQLYVVNTKLDAKKQIIDRNFEPTHILSVNTSEISIKITKNKEIHYIKVHL